MLETGSTMVSLGRFDDPTPAKQEGIGDKAKRE
jgi:hypothetical protein